MAKRSLLSRCPSYC